MNFRQCLGLCRQTRVCRYFTFIAHNAPGPLGQGSKCRSRKRCSDCLLYQTCPHGNPYNCHECFPKTHVLRKLHANIDTKEQGENTYGPTILGALGAALASSDHLTPAWSAKDSFCDHVPHLNKERWGITPRQCKAKCFALKSCKFYMVVPSGAPGPKATKRGSLTDCLLYSTCPSLKRYGCINCKPVTYMLPGRGGVVPPPLTRSPTPSPSHFKASTCKNCGTQLYFDYPKLQAALARVGALPHPHLVINLLGSAQNIFYDNWCALAVIFSDKK